MKKIILGILITIFIVIGLFYLVEFERYDHLDSGAAFGFLIYFGIVFQMILAIICGNMASNKGRDGFSWGFLEFLFGPIVLIIVAAMTPTPKGD